MYETKITIHALFINIHTLKNIKMDFTVLFTHLKIIFLRYFPFSVFSFSNIKKGKIYWRIKYRFLEVGSTDFWHTCDPGNVGSPGENQERSEEINRSRNVLDRLFGSLFLPMSFFFFFYHYCDFFSLSLTFLHFLSYPNVTFSYMRITWTRRMSKKGGVCLRGLRLTIVSW